MSMNQKLHIKREKYQLTEHARERLAERTGVTEDEFLALAARAAILVYRANAEAEYDLVWSSKDRNGYVLVVAPATGHIITINTIINQAGYPCLVRDEHKKPKAGFESCGAGVSSITSAMLEQAVQAAGADICEAEAQLAILKNYEAAHRARHARTWTHRWVVRFLAPSEKGATGKSKELGKEVSAFESPPAEIVEKAVALVREAGGWDARLSLVERDSQEDVGEWELMSA